jgi:hypothetical protein
MLFLIVVISYSVDIHCIYCIYLRIHVGESVNRSEMDIKRKTCDIRTWKKHLFLDISSTNIYTLVQSLYQRVETRCTEVF